MPFGISEGIAAGGSLLSGLFGKNAANSAASKQAAAAKEVAQMAQQAVQTGQAGVTSGLQTATGDVAQGTTGANTQLQNVFSGQTNNLNPYLNLGTQSANSLATALAPGGSLAQTFNFAPTQAQLAATPGYQFQLAQGTQAVQNSAAASGLLQSGSTLEGLQNYAQGLAGTYYQNAYNNALNTYQTNRNNTFQGLLAGTQVGQTGTAQYNQAAENYGNTSAGNIYNNGLFAGNATNQASQFNANLGLQGAQIAGNAITGGANAQAAGIVGGANALSAGITGAGNSIANYNTLGAIYGQGQPTYGPGSPPTPGSWGDLLG